MHIDSDSPIHGVQEDRFGFADTVLPRLVSVVTEWPSVGGTVIGLTGSWGSGKTSVLNMAEGRIAEITGPDSVLRFSPWSYDDPASLTLAFFGILKEHLVKSDDTNLKVVGSALGKIGLGLGVAASGLRFAGVSFDATVLKGAAEVLQGTGGLLESLGKADAQVVSAMKDARKALLKVAEAGQRLVVFIDDVDRLSYDELTVLFRLMRTVAELPAVTLVVAMDERRVRNMLRRVPKDELGADYLEKIVQTKIHVPPPSRPRMRAAIVARLQAVFKAAGVEYPESLQDHALWSPEELRLLESLLATPRDVARFSNSLFVLLLGAGGEHVDPVDAALLCAVEATFPEGYEAIRGHRNLFLGVTDGWMVGEEKQKDEEARSEDYARILEGLPDLPRRSAFERVVTNLFGDVSKRIENRGGVFGDRQRYRRLRQPSHFDTYFYAQAPSLLTPKLTDELASWLCGSEKEATEAVDAISHLGVEGAEELVGDLAHTLRARGKFHVGVFATRLSQVLQHAAGDSERAVLIRVASTVVERRPNTPTGSWTDFLKGLREVSGGDADWIEFIRWAVRQTSQPEIEWLAVAAEWLSENRAILVDPSADIPWEDTVDWIVELRLVAEMVEQGQGLVVAAEIGARVGQQPELLPSLLRSVSVQSGERVSLRGGIRSPDQAVAGILGHFESPEALSKAIEAWVAGGSRGDEHGLVAELTELLEKGAEN